MAITVVASSTSVVSGVATATQLAFSPGTLPTGTAVGDRVFVFAAYRGGSAFPPAGGNWKNAYTYVYPGLNTQLAASGPRMQSCWYQDYTGEPLGNVTIGADFNGQTAAVVGMITLRKGATEEWAEPSSSFGNDNTAASPHAVTGATALPIRAGSVLLMHDAWPSDPGTVTTPTVTATGMTSGTVTSRLAKAGTTLGDDVYHALYSAQPSVGATNNIAAPTRSGAITTARTGHTLFINQDLVDQIDKPLTERVPAYENKFDPRTGITDAWMGSDMARDVDVNGTARLWIFADTFWQPSMATGTPTSRTGYEFTHSSLAWQAGPDLATSTVTFHRAPGGGDWFPATGTHYFWPQDGIFIGNDLYVMCQRVLASSPLGAEYGWAVFKITNAKTLAITSWPVATKLYESADSSTRPIWSAYDGGDGFIYSFAIARAATGGQNPGWRWCRWSTANFTGSNTQGAVTYYSVTGTWTTDVTQSLCIAENKDTSEGSVHKRTEDGRWIITEQATAGPDSEMGLRVAGQQSGGVYQPAIGTAGGFWPPPLQLIKMPGDWVLDSTASNTPARVVHVNSNGDRVLQYPTTPNPTYAVKTNAQCLAYARTERYIYKDPRFDSATNTDPNLSVYAMKAHPLIPDSAGLIATYVDNTDSATAVTAGGLAVYWPKFVRILKPLVSAVSVTSGGVATWTASGGPDRQFYRVNGGAWTELDPTLRTVTVGSWVVTNSFEVLVRNLGGDTTAGSFPAMTVNPNVVSSTPATYAPSVTSDVTISITPIVITPSVYVPDLSSDVVVLPGVPPDVSAIYAPTVSAATDVTPDVVAAAPATYAPDLTSDVTVAPATIPDVVSTAYAPVLGGDITVAPATIPDVVSTAYAPSVTVDQDVTPDLVAATPQIYGPTVTTDVTADVDFLPGSPATYAPDITTAVTSTPNLVAATPAVYAPDISADVTVAPDYIATLGQTFDPSVDTAITVAPDTVAATPATYAPDADASVDVVPDDLIFTASIYDAAIIGDQNALPDTIDDTSIVYPQAVSAFVTVTPDLVSTSPALYDPTSGGDITVAPTDVTATPAVYAPDITATISVTPDLIAVSPVLYAPDASTDTATTPDLLDGAPTTYNPSAAGDTSGTPDSIDDTAQLYDPSATSDLIIATPNLLLGNPVALPPVLGSEYVAEPEGIGAFIEIFEPTALSDTSVLVPEQLVISPVPYDPELDSDVTITPDAISDGAVIELSAAYVELTISPSLLNGAPAIYAAAIDTAIDITPAPDIVEFPPVATFSPAISAETTVSAATLGDAPVLYPPLGIPTQIITPDLVSSTASVLAPDIGIFTTASPDTLTVPAVLYGPSWTGATDVIPDTIADTATVPGGNIDTDIPILVQRIDSTPTTYPPGLSGDVSVEPELIVSTPIVRGATLTSSLIIASPTLLTSTTVLYFPKGIGGAIRQDQLILMPTVQHPPVIYQLGYPKFDILVWDDTQWVLQDALQWNGVYWVDVEPVSAS